MIYEKAIYWLDEIKRAYIKHGDEDYDRQRKEAIDFAIYCITDWQAHMRGEEMELIKRDDVIKILNDEIYTEECEFDDGDCVVCWVVDDKDAVIARIKRLPTYESRPKGKWIETKDELPSGDVDWVVAVVREKDTGFIWLPRVMEYRKCLNDWLFQNERGWLSDEVNQGLEVVAWCPLPEPYDADMRGEE